MVYAIIGAAAGLVVVVVVTVVLVCVCKSPKGGEPWSAAILALQH